MIRKKDFISLAELLTPRLKKKKIFFVARGQYGKRDSRQHEWRYAS